MSDFNGGSDWNGNGEHDAFDDYMDYELYEKESDNYDVYNSGGHRTTRNRTNNDYKKAAQHYELQKCLIWIGVIIVASIINPLLGGIIAFFWLYGMIFLGF